MSLSFTKFFLKPSIVEFILFTCKYVGLLTLWNLVLNSLWFKKISLKMTPIEFQREVGRLEVLGELLIREK